MVCGNGEDGCSEKEVQEEEKMIPDFSVNFSRGFQEIRLQRFVVSRVVEV